MAQSNRTVSLVTGAALVGIGMVMGYFVRPMVRPMVSPPVAAVEPEAPAAGSGKIVVVNETTIDNMNLETGKFQVRNYNEPIRIPAEIVERIPGGRRLIVAPVGGRVDIVHVSPGEAVAPGGELFDLIITDEELSRAQVDLLGVIAETNTVRSRLEKLRGLLQSGAVAGKKVKNVELELQKLAGNRQALVQELELRGVRDSQVQQLIGSGRLIESVKVYAPDLPDDVSSDHYFFTVESVDGIQGGNLVSGGKLCELTHHGTLLIKGLAFESDVEKISEANAAGERFTAEFGEGPNTSRLENLPLLSIDNRVDDRSQTYPVYVEIVNEVTGESQDARGRRYLQWKYKPGQRVHLEVPARVWTNGVVVPIDAVVREGAEAFVFKRLDHDHGPTPEPVVEFEKVPVKILYSDRRFAILEKQLKLDLYENYVLSQAYQINLALKQASGGGGNSHGHSRD